MSPCDELARLGSATIYEAGGPARLRRRRPAPDRARLERRRARAHGALRPGRQPDGPRRHGRGPRRRRAGAHDARAGALRAVRRPARDPGERAGRRGGARGRLRPRRGGPGASWGCRCGRGTSASRGRPSRRSGRSTCRWWSAAPRSGRATRSCSTATASRWSPADDVTTVLDAAHEREAREAAKREQLQAGRALLRPRRAAGDRGRRMSDIAHLGPAELLTPKPAESLGSSTTCWDGDRARGAPVRYLRGWGDYQPYSLKLTEAPAAGLASLGSARATPRRSSGASRVEATGLGEGWTDGDRGRGRSYRFRDPDGHAFDLYCEMRALRAARRAAPVAEEPAPALRRPRRRRQAARPRQRAGRHVRPNRVFANETLGYRLLRAIELDDGDRGRRLAVASIAAHELIYIKDAYGPGGPPAPPRVLGRHPRGVPARRRPLPRPGIEIEAAPSKHAIAQGFFLYGVRAGREPDRGHHRRLLRLRPRPAEPVVWTEAERAAGPVLGRQDRRELPHLRDAADPRRRRSTPAPPASPLLPSTAGSRSPSGSSIAISRASCARPRTSSLR